jgi:hypothetical protein
MLKIVNSFNAGELSPRLLGRVDWEKYSLGCKTLENFVPHVHGGVRRRSGSAHISNVKDDTKKVRLIPFVFNVTTAYCLEFGEQYIRFYKNGVQIGAPFEVTTPYLENELRDIRFEESADVMYLTSPTHEPRKLQRFADDNWTLTIVDFQSGPFLDANITDTSIALSYDDWMDATVYAIDDVVNIDEATQTIAAAAAVDSGVGIVRITTSAPHGYLAGDIIYISGTVNYDGQYKLDPSFTASVLAIKAAFVAETFTTADTVLRRRFFKALTAHTSAIGGPPFETPPGNTADWIEIFNFTGANIILTASAALFDVLHIGSIWQITHTRESFGLSGSFAAVEASFPIVITTGVTLTTNGTWTGTIEVQRSDDNGFSWETLNTYTGANDRNVIDTFNETKANSLYRFVMTARASGTVNWEMKPDSPFVSGIIKITAFTSSTVMKGTVLETLSGVAATTDWAEGAWSDFRGYPRTVSFFEERLAFFGSSAKPLTGWLSKTNSFEDMRAGILDADAIVLNLASDLVNQTQWLESQQSLIVGTAGGEWRIGAGNLDLPMTPTNITARRQSANGSENVQGLLVDDAILFVQRTGRKVREMSFNDDRQSLVSPDLSIQSEHITESGIVETAYSPNQSTLFFAIRADGVLSIFVYDRIQEVFAWARWTTDGKYESLTVVPGVTEDEIYVSINRTINGGTERHIELIKPLEFIDQHDMWFLDDALEFDGGPVVTISAITNASPGVVSSTAHGLITDDHVKIQGATGMIEINGTWKVVRINDNSYSLKVAGGSTAIDTTAFGTFTLPIQNISNITNADQAVMTATAHGLFTGQLFGIALATGMTEVNNLSFHADVIDVNSVRLMDSVTGQFINSTYYAPYISSGLFSSQVSGQKVAITFSGLSHLEGKYVSIVGDGAVRQSQTVVSGQVTTEDYFNRVKAGLPYRSILEPMPLENQLGSSQGAKSKISRVGVRLNKSYNFKVGSVVERLQEQSFMTSLSLTDVGDRLFSGYKEIEFPVGYHNTQPIIFSQDAPLPLEVSSLMVEMQTGKL